jgi:hypothetical protein
MLFIVLLIAAVVYYFINNTSNYTVKCNIKSDYSCKMYNQRDIQSKCSSMCVAQNPNYIFTGKHTLVNNEHACECDYPKEKFTLDFTNVDENPDILPDVVPSDVKFSDRNYLEKEQEKRYGNLIFGVSSK